MPPWVRGCLLCFELVLPLHSSDKAVADWQFPVVYLENILSSSAKRQVQRKLHLTAGLKTGRTLILKYLAYVD